MGPHPHENCDLAVRLLPLTVIALGTVGIILFLERLRISLHSRGEIKEHNSLSGVPGWVSSMNINKHRRMRNTH